MAPRVRRGRSQSSRSWWESGHRQDELGEEMLYVHLGNLVEC